MSIKYPNKERQPLVNSFFTVFKDNSYPMIRNWARAAATLDQFYFKAAIELVFDLKF